MVGNELNIEQKQMRWIELSPIYEDGKWGFEDNKGTIVIETQFDEVQRFSEGLAPVKIYGHWGYIDETGIFVINPTFTAAGDFKNGLALVEYKGNHRQIDKTGNRKDTIRKE